MVKQIKLKVNSSQLFCKLIITIVALFTTGFNETLANESEYLIVWWNVENLFDTVNDPRTNDDEYTPTGKREWTAQRLNKKFENLAQVIKDISQRNKKKFPDIMGFCEVENEPLLDHLYKEYVKAIDYKIIYHESKDSRGIDVSFVYNSKTFRFINKKVIGIKVNDKPTRDVLLGHFKDIKNSNDLYVFLNHWPSRIGGEEKTELKRISAAKSLRRAVDSLLKKNVNADIVIMGDFNDEPVDKSILTYLKSRGSTDDVKNGKAGELYNFTYSYQFGSMSYRNKWLKFDQILASKGMFDSKGFFVKDDAFDVFSTSYLKRFEGKRKKHEVVFRTYSNGEYRGGYADHLPVILRIKSH